MRFAGRVLRGVGALVLVAALLVGVPVLLIVVAGYPLPTKMPNWDHVYWAARQGNITSTFIIKTLACVVWLAWAQVAWAIVWEFAVNVPTVAAGRRRRPTPFALAPASRFAHQLVSAALIVTAISSAASSAVAQTPSLHSLVSSAGSTAPPPAALVVDSSSTAPAGALIETNAPTYRVQAGDTLWDVAERCLGDGALVDEIVACNPHLSAARRLRPGTVLELPAHARIPQTSSEAGTPAVDAAVHVVVEGDTLWDIVADHYGAADRALVASVAAHNQIGDPSLIHPYDRIELPTDLARQVADESVGGNALVVVTGDTLWDIVAGHYGVADRDMVWAVADANQLENPSLIFPGQRLTLPDDPVREAPDPAPATPSVDDPAPATSQADAPQLEEPAVPDTVATESAVAGPPPSVDSPTIPASPDAAAPWDSPNATTAPSEVPIGPVADTAQIAASSTDDAPAGSAASNAPAIDSDTSVLRGGSELVSARWLFGGAAVTALGLVGAWATLRRLRKRRRRWLDLDEPVAATAMVLPAQETTAQRSIAAIKQLVAADGRPTPAAIGAVTDTERVVVLFDEPRPEPPPGWTATELGWHRSLNDDLSGSPEVLTAGLVTLGTTAAGAEVLLDLAAARSVSVRGEGEAVERLMCSMLWELASQPLDGPTVELYVVGLACAASRVTSSPGELIDLSTAAELASWPREPGDPLQVFLVDPFGEDANTAELNALVSACATGAGRAVVVAGACEHPAEDVLVPSVDTATWRTMSLRPSQLPDNVDRQLAATLSAVVVGRRHQQGCAAAASVFDPEAEAVSLRSVALLTTDEGPTPSPGGGWDGINDDSPTDAVGEPNGGPPVAVDRATVLREAPSELPDVLLRTAGRQVEVVGAGEGIGTKAAEVAVTFLLAAAGREMHGSEVSELTGYSTKTLHNAITAAHPLIHRANGVMTLRDGVRTDHEWATECVRRLAAAIENADASEQNRWLRSGFDALHTIEQGPYAVLPTKDRSRRNGVSPWAWVDEYPVDVSARDRAETELAEAALAYTELWCSIPAAELIRPTDLVNILSRLAMVVPYAVITRQVRSSMWSSGAECLLEAAMRVAADDVTLQQRVQRTARAMVARQQLEATDDLADLLGL